MPTAARICICGALVLGVSPALAGPCYLTDDPEPTDYQHFEIYNFTNGTATRANSSGEAGIDINYGGATCHISFRCGCRRTGVPDPRLAAAAAKSIGAANHGIFAIGAGAHYDVSNTFHLLGYLGRGIQNADETNRLNWCAGVLVTF